MPQLARVSKPPSVEAAMQRRDTSFLSQSGKKGAKTKKEREANRLLFELRLRAEQANEHICPVDD